MTPAILISALVIAIVLSFFALAFSIAVAVRVLQGHPTVRKSLLAAAAIFAFNLAFTAVGYALENRPFVEADPVWRLVIGLLQFGLSLVSVAGCLCYFFGLSLPKAAAAMVLTVVLNLVIGLAFAFTFRSMLAEAFVQPTGSMAPAVFGIHRDIVCENCNYTYSISSSGEEEDSFHPHEPPPKVMATCPLCRHEQTVPTKKSPLGGDRFLVNKLAFRFGEPARWEIIIFKYPEDPRVNYLKRLVGLPGETVRIEHGDLFAKRGDGSFEILRKPPALLRTMAQVVYDNDYVADAMTQKGWPVRWQPWEKAGSPSNAGQWTSADGSRTYDTDGSAPEDVWMRYQHFLPVRDWTTLDVNQLSGSAPPKPQLITDSCAYNGVHTENGWLQTLGLDWVGDLLLESALELKSNTGSILLDLVKGGKHFRCTLDVATGHATLTIDGLEDFHPAAQTVVRGPGSHRVLFSNVDRELRLWIDDSVVTFDAPTTYSDLDNDLPQSTPDDPGDLAPAGIGSRGAAVRVSHLRLLRDIYYIADKEDGRPLAGGICDYLPGSAIPAMNAEALADFMSNPHEWQGELQQRQAVEFPLAEGQYFMLGDNSPQSKDSRLWYPEHYVDRKLLIGKLMATYWPPSRWRCD